MCGTWLSQAVHLIQHQYQVLSSGCRYSLIYSRQSYSINDQIANWIVNKEIQKDFIMRRKGKKQILWTQNCVIWQNEMNSYKRTLFEISSTFFWYLSMLGYEIDCIDSVSTPVITFWDKERVVDDCTNEEFFFNNSNSTHYIYALRPKRSADLANSTACITVFVKPAVSLFLA